MAICLLEAMLRLSRKVKDGVVASTTIVSEEPKVKAAIAAAMISPKV